FDYGGNNVDQAFERLGLQEVEPKTRNRKQRHLLIGVVVFGLGNADILSQAKALEEELSVTNPTLQSNQATSQKLNVLPQEVVTAFKRRYSTFQEFLASSHSNLL